MSANGSTDCFLQCLEPNGTLNWQVVLGGNDVDRCHGLAKSTYEGNEGIVLVGNTWSFEVNRVTISVFKLSLDGEYM